MLHNQLVTGIVVPNGVAADCRKPRCIQRCQTSLHDDFDSVGDESTLF